MVDLRSEEQPFRPPSLRCVSRPRGRGRGAKRAFIRPSRLARSSATVTFLVCPCTDHPCAMVMLSEEARRVGGLRMGDEVRGWTSDDNLSPGVAAFWAK